MRLIMHGILAFFICSVLGAGTSYAKKIDGSLSYFIKDSDSEAAKELEKEFNKSFEVIKAFNFAEKTDYYLYYIPISGEAEMEVSAIEAPTISSERFSKYLQTKNNTYNFKESSSKPYSGSMYLYDSYGDVIFIVRNKDQYNSPKRALQNTAGLMKKRIDGETDKLLKQKTNRCLLCDYSSVSDEQKNQILEILYLTHQKLLPEQYTHPGSEPNTLEPYADLYFSRGDIKNLDYILDTGAVSFDHPINYDGQETHIINEAIRQKYPNSIIDKIAVGYKKNNFNVSDNNILPPLFVAVGYQDIEVIKALIGYGADVNQQTSFGTLVLTPLNISVQNGSLETTRLLLKNGAVPGYGLDHYIFPWEIAMYMGKYDQASLIWPELPADRSSAEAQSLLIEAVYFGQQDLIQQLVSQGVPVTSKDRNGAGLIIAAIKGIKDFSGTVDEQDPTQARHKVDEATYWSIIDTAKKDGLNTDVKTDIDINKRGVLYYAYPQASSPLSEKHFQLLKKLAQMGVNPKATDVYGETANEVYKQARLNYIENNHKKRLEQFADLRKEAGQRSQAREDQIKKLALEASTANERYQKQQKVVSNLKRQSSLNDAKQRVINQAPVGGVPIPEFSSFERDASDAQKKLNLYKSDLDAANKAARDAYIIDAQAADAEYNEQVEQENAFFEQQKLTELETINKAQQLTLDFYAE